MICLMCLCKRRLRGSYNMDKQKEALEIKKLFLTQIENFENKIYYSLLIFSTSIIILSLKSEISVYYSFVGFILFIFITLLFILLQKKRKDRFNKLLHEI